MANQMVALSYAGHGLEAIQDGGELWLTVRQLVAPLGFADEKSVRKIYERNADEFTASESRLMALTTETRGDVQMRVFSLRGCRLLALLARTPQAKAFRRWVLDLLEGRVTRQPVAVQLALPGTHKLPLEAVEALDELAGLLEPGHPALTALRQLQDGSRPLSPSATVAYLVSRFEAARRMQRDTNKSFRAVAAEALRCGYTFESIKRAAQQARSAGHAG